MVTIRMSYISRFFKVTVIFLILLHECNLIQIKDNRKKGQKFDTSRVNKADKILYFGVIVPHLTFLLRPMHTAVNMTVQNLYSDKPMPKNFNFLKYYRIEKKVVALELAASPLDILNATCEMLVKDKIVTLLYLTTSDNYGSNAASAQYLLQLTGYLGIPVIAWNADNAGLEQIYDPDGRYKKSQINWFIFLYDTVLCKEVKKKPDYNAMAFFLKVSDSKILQLAPSVEHQAMAMLDILKRYSWHAFAVVTSRLGGHEDFIRAVRDLVQREIYPEFKYDIIDVLTLKKKHRNEIAIEMEDLANSEARIMLLFATQSEAIEILAAATEQGITGRHHVWICAHSVLSRNIKRAPGVFPTGMLGVSFNSSYQKLQEELKRSLMVFFYGLELFVNDQKSLHNVSLQPNMTCTGSGPARWNMGDILYKYLREVEIESPSLSDTEFNADGTVKYVELEIKNINNQGNWQKVGDWNKNGLEIKDIVWPGGSPSPPPGVPEKFNLKVTFLEEAPYVNLGDLDSETGECKISRSVKCRIAPEEKFMDVNLTLAQKNNTFFKCCHGFCIDLLLKFAQDLGFSYDLYRVEDEKWGALSVNGSWNGLIADVLHHKADIIVTSIKINSERQTAADFTIPFLETGISIVVAKRTGIISPKAFLEPFDTVSWLMILLVCIQLAALAIFLFEWLSPHGYDMKMLPPREDANSKDPDHKFSLFRTYWLVWAILFGAAVNVDCPRGFAARFVSGVWAMFAVVFLAIYTANLAAFMITREEFYDLQGIEDKRLVNPYSMEPPFRYGTIPSGNTEAVLKRNKEDLYLYMKNFNRSTVREGIASVKNGDLDAFIYDATVLEYLVGQDNECRLLTVGTWYAMTGYGFALPKKSKYLSMFNKVMLQYRENGDLERLQRFWLQGACKPKAQKRNVSKPLDVNQFMSAFLLLGCGVLFTILVLVLEHIYFRYVRKHLAKKDAGGCFTLISLSMGKSLSFRGAVFEAADIMQKHHCKDPTCDNTLWKTRHELQIAKLKIQQLESELHGQRRPPRNISIPRDLTKDIIATTEESSEAARTLHPYGPHFIKTATTPTDVAEIETVL